MKNPNELRRYVLFQLNECDAIKEYLEEMALKGWALKYIRTFFCFEKIEPQKLIYSIEVFSKASVYDTVPATPTNEYIDYCKEAGWSFICNIGQVNIFVATSESAVPIETDERLKFKTIRKGMLKQNAITWFCLVPLFIFNVTLDFMSFESFITNNIGLMSFLFYMIFFAVVIIQVISFVVWTIKQSRRLKRGESIQYISKSGRRKRTILQLSPLFIMTFVLFVVGFISLLQGDYSTMLMTAFIILFVPLIFIFSHFLQKRGLGRTANKVIPIVLGFGISFIIMILAVFMVLMTDSDTMPNNEARFYSKTFIASTTTFDYITESNTEISITVFKSEYSPIINQYLYSETHHFFINEFSEIDMPEWNAETSFISNYRYCIKFDTYVISFYCDKSLTRDDIAKIKSLVG